MGELIHKKIEISYIIIALIVLPLSFHIGFIGFNIYTFYLGVLFCFFGYMIIIAIIEAIKFYWL